MAKSHSTYVYGTEARQEAVQNARKPYVSAREQNEAVRRNRKDALRMDLPFLIMLMAASIAALYICCNYIRIQSAMTTSMKRIESREKALETLRGENDALETRINANQSLDYIYDVATNELGMVYARQSQVVRYDRTPNEYVRQYEDIPR